MSTAIAEPPPTLTRLASAPPPFTPPAEAINAAGPEPGGLYRWTVERYERLGELGVLTPEHRVELLDGVIVDKEMNHPPHAECVDQLTEFFHVANLGRWWVRGQHPVRLSDQDSMPEPDLALVRRRPEGYRTRHPGPDDVFLLIEVANTSVAVDRGRKLALYACAGIAEYWIVNVPENVVEVYRGPQPSKGSYAHAETLHPGAMLAPAAFPDAAFPVATLLGAEAGPDAAGTGN